MAENASLLDEHNGNGHDPDSDEVLREGATLPLEILRREDGIISLAASSANRNNSGVLVKLITVDNSSDIDQELKTGNYTSPAQQDYAALAISECEELGDEVGLRTVKRMIIARKAGTNSSLVTWILNALTHTSFTTNYQGGLGNAKGTSNARKNSPIP